MKNFIFGLLIFFIASSFLGFAAALGELIKKSIVDCQKQYYQEGFDAQKHGVPANANPYIRNENYAPYWLKGWMAATEEGKK